MVNELNDEGNENALSDFTKNTTLIWFYIKRRNLGLKTRKKK